MKKNYKERMRVELIDEFMKKNNMSTYEFCEQSRVNKDTLDKMYKNNFDFDIIYLFRVCKFIGIEMKDFFVDDIKNI